MTEGNIDVYQPATAKDWHDVIRMFADKGNETALLLAQRELCRLHRERA